MWLLKKYYPLHCTAATWPFKAGIAIVLAGLLLEVFAVLSFRRKKTTINPLRPENTSTLVTDGIYTMSRNPMYLGMAIILTGVALMMGCLSPLGMPLVFCIVVTLMQIIPEERSLSEIFGTDYDNYKNSVGRWF